MDKPYLFTQPVTQLSVQIDTFYVLDFDKTLGDILTIYDRFVHLLIQKKIADAHHLVELRTKVESMGGSFDVVTCLMSEGRVNSDMYATIRAEFVAQLASLDVLLPGAKELLASLRNSGSSFGILTYGGQLWQDTKIQASKLDDIPRIVTQTKEKGKLIADWRQADGQFAIPTQLSPDHPLVARNVVLVDDKAASFEGFPESNATGYYVFDEASAVAAQRGCIPANVTKIHTLYDIIGLIS